AEIIIAKHRNGSLDDVRLRFIGELAKFANKEQGSTMIMESKMNDSSGFDSPMDGPSGYPDLPTPDAGDVPF
ncbi:MAG: replicative DNA helicase, partial [Schleiferiaceae bacterium]